jgi:hypothetical protein
MKCFFFFLTSFSPQRHRAYLDNVVCIVSCGTSDWWRRKRDVVVEFLSRIVVVRRCPLFFFFFYISFSHRLPNSHCSPPLDDNPSSGIRSSHHWSASQSMKKLSSTRGVRQQESFCRSSPGLVVRGHAHKHVKPFARGPFMFPFRSRRNFFLLFSVRCLRRVGFLMGLMPIGVFP